MKTEDQQCFLFRIYLISFQMILTTIGTDSGPTRSASGLMSHSSTIQLSELVAARLTVQKNDTLRGTYSLK